jgi:hypothetical protein
VLQLPERLVVAETLPRTEIGKIDKEGPAGGYSEEARSRRKLKSEPQNIERGMSNSEGKECYGRKLPWQPDIPKDREGTGL